MPIRERAAFPPTSILVFLRPRRLIHDIFELRAASKWILLGAIAGLASGLGAVLFHVVLEHVSSFLQHDLASFYPPPAGGEGSEAPPDAGPPRRWLLVVLPVIGGLVSGWLVFRFASEAEGHGTDALLRAFHRLRGEIRGRIPIVKSVASILTIGAGGSAGREGPIAQVGAGLGSAIGSRLRLSNRDRRLIMLAAAAGGIGAIFRAPLGAALFVTEVLYRDVDFEFEAIVPSVISSIVAYSVFVAFFPEMERLFHVPDTLRFANPLELVPYAGLAVLLALAGLVWVRVFYGGRDHVFRRIRVPTFLKPAIGGLGLGILGWFLPQILAQGYGWVQQAIDGHLAVTTMFLLAGGKILATTLTISSGGSGGVFGPSVFIGAMLGGAYGYLLHEWLPGLVQNPGAYVLVGMAGFFAGVAKVPIASLIMVCELSGGYELIVPLMLVCVLAFLFSRNWTLYEEQVATILDSPAHLGDFVQDVLADMTVDSILDRERPVETIPETATLRQILARVADSEVDAFPVVDASGRLCGMILLRDLRAAFHETASDALVIARDLATEQVLTVTATDDLNRALRALTLRNVDEIPVIDSEDSRRVVGLVSRRDLIAAYDERVRELRSDG